MGRHSCCTKQKLRKGLWSPEEDEKLYNYITRNGVGCWSSIPKQAGLQRCGKSCRLRWINYLRPDLKRGMFSQHEEELIVNLHKALGNRWAQIAAQLPGRTDNEIKNLWNSCLKKKLMKQGIDPKTHKQLNEPRHEQNCTTTTRGQNSAAAPGNTNSGLHKLPLQRSTNNQEQYAAPSLVPPPASTTTWSAIKTEFCPTSSYYCCNNNSSTDIGLIQSGHGFFSSPVFDTSISSTPSSAFHIFQPGSDNFLINNFSSMLLDQYHQNSDHQTTNFEQQEAAGGGAELISADNCDHDLNLPNLITTTSSNYLGETDISSDSCSTQGGGGGVRSNSFFFNDEVKESSTSGTTTTTTNLDTTAVLSWENKNKLEYMLETYSTHDHRHDDIKMEEDLHEHKLDISPWQQQIHYGDGDQFSSSSCPLKSFSEDLYGLNFDIFQQM